MRLSAEGAMKVKSAAQKKKSIGQKWKPGDSGVVFYPTFTDETGMPHLLVAALWGHSIDRSQLNIKSNFLPCLTDIDENGMPIGVPDITYQFSRIAKMFVEGMKKADENKVFAKMWDSEKDRKLALDNIEFKYDTKNNPDAIASPVKPLDYKILTEVVYVPLVNGVPKVDEAEAVMQDLSNARIAKLNAVLHNPQYSTLVDGFLEVQYNFPLQEKKQAGQTDPVGVNVGFHMCEQFPDEWKRVQPKLEEIPKESELMANHSWNSIKFTEKEIKNALRSYAITNSEYLEILEDDSEERLVKNVALIKDLGLIKQFTTNSELRQKLEEAATALEPEAEKRPTGEEEVAPAQNLPPTIEELVKNASTNVDELEIVP